MVQVILVLVRMLVGVAPATLVSGLATSGHCLAWQILVANQDYNSKHFPDINHNQTNINPGPQGNF